MGQLRSGSDSADSDVDIAILMRGALNSDIEDRLSDFIVDMNLKYDKVFSVIDIDFEHYQKWMPVLPFYQNVNKDGIVLWTAA